MAFLYFLFCEAPLPTSSKCSLCYNKHEFAEEVVGGAPGVAADYRAVLMP